MKQASCSGRGDGLKNLVKELRTAHKMTQQQLAELVHVSSREKGQYNPSLLLAYRIAKVFDTSVEELYCLEENLELDEKQYRELQTDVGKGEQ